MKKITLLAISIIFQNYIFTQEHFAKELALYKSAIQLPDLIKKAKEQKKLNDDIYAFLAKVPALKADQEFFKALSNVDKAAQELIECLTEIDTLTTTIPNSDYSSSDVVNLIKNLKNKEPITNSELSNLYNTITSKMLKVNNPEATATNQEIQTLVPGIKADLAANAKEMQEYLQKNFSLLLQIAETKTILDLTNLDEISKQPDDCIFDTIERTHKKLRGIIEHINTLNNCQNFLKTQGSGSSCSYYDLEKQKKELINLKQKISQLECEKQQTISRDLEHLVTDIQNKKISHSQFAIHLTFMQQKKEELKELKSGIDCASVKPEFKKKVAITLQILDEQIEHFTERSQQFTKTKKTPRPAKPKPNKDPQSKPSHPLCKIPVEPMSAQILAATQQETHHQRKLIEICYLQRNDGPPVKINALMFITDKAKKITGEQAAKKNAKKSLSSCQTLSFLNGAAEETVMLDIEGDEPTTFISHTPGGEYYAYTPASEDYAYKISQIIGYYYEEGIDSADQDSEIEFTNESSDEDQDRAIDEKPRPPQKK